MLRAVEQIDWVRDESMVVDRLKTGELPPPDIQVLSDATKKSFSYFQFSLLQPDLQGLLLKKEILSCFSLSVPGHV